MFRCLVDYEYVDSEYVDYDWKYLVDNPYADSHTGLWNSPDCVVLTAYHETTIIYQLCPHQPTIKSTFDG